MFYIAGDYMIALILLGQGDSLESEIIGFGPSAGKYNFRAFRSDKTGYLVTRFIYCLPGGLTTSGSTGVEAA
jgi:hypothetical protein